MNSGATAITRKTVSAPTRWILDNYFVHGRVLHYGEGKYHGQVLRKTNSYMIVKVY